MSLERMDDFFTARISGYDQHMLQNVEGCREAYEVLARLVPEGTATLLDLGCGTGLELEAIFRRFPKVEVTGIDMTQAMLDKLLAKYSEKPIRLICGSYFDVAFGAEAFDAAISFQTMHHFSHEKKAGLYGKIRRALKPHGQYIECDYVAADLAQENAFFAENARMRMDQGIPPEAFYHFDTPITVENQLRLFQEAGFQEAETPWRFANTAIFIAKKG